MTDPRTGAQALRDEPPAHTDRQVRTGERGARTGSGDLVPHAALGSCAAKGVAR